MDISVLFGTNCYNTDIFLARYLRFCREVHIDDYDDNEAGDNDVDNNNNFVSTKQKFNKNFLQLEMMFIFQVNFDFICNFPWHSNHSSVSPFFESAIF